MNPPRKFRLLLASSRAANLPGVVVNIWLGVALAAWTETLFARPYPVVAAMMCLIPAGIALYLGGNLLNDWHDREWDARHRPERALPRGTFRPVTFLLAGLALLAAGILAAWWFHPASAATAALISVFIAGYTIWHKRHPATVVLVGLCRALLPLLALAGPVSDLCSTFGPGILWLITPSLALFCHVVGLSVRARHETVNPGTGGSAFAIVALAAAGPLMLVTVARSTPIIANLSLILLPAIIAWAVWTTRAISRFRQSPGRQVAALLAGIPLLDWIILLPLGKGCASLAIVKPIFAIRPPGATADMIPDFTPLGPVGVVSMLLPPLAFVASLALQRLAPAT